MDHLNRDHERIELVLRLIERELAKFDDDDQDENLPAIAAALAYIEAYPDKVHHPVEERMFDCLDSISSIEMQRVLQTLRRQHAEITASTLKLKRDIDDVLNDIVTPIGKIKRHLADYLTLQRTHMSLERREIFPAAEANLSEADWQELHARLVAELDPLFDQRQAEYDLIYTEVVEDLERAEGESKTEPVNK